MRRWGEVTKGEENREGGERRAELGAVVGVVSF